MQLTNKMTEVLGQHRVEKGECPFCGDAYEGEEVEIEDEEAIQKETCIQCGSSWFIHYHIDFACGFKMGAALVEQLQKENK